MPRPKVTEQARRRVAKACITCQATKQKCDGRAPCAPCDRRGQTAACSYSSHERSYGARRRRQQKGPRDETSGQILSTSPVDSSANDRSSRHHPPPNQTDSPSARIEVTIPKLSRALHDTKGRVRKPLPIPNPSGPGFKRLIMLALWQSTWAIVLLFHSFNTSKI